MQDLVASRTALGTSLMRALHTRVDPQPIINDPWGDRLVPELVIEAIRQRALSGMSDDSRAEAEAASESILDAWLRANPSYANVIIRSRYTEDALHTAIARGTGTLFTNSVYNGHSALMGKVKREWQDTDYMSSHILENVRLKRGRHTNPLLKRG